MNKKGVSPELIETLRNINQNNLSKLSKNTKLENPASLMNKWNKLTDPKGIKQMNPAQLWDLWNKLTK